LLKDNPKEYNHRQARTRKLPTKDSGGECISVGHGRMIAL